MKRILPTIALLCLAGCTDREPLGPPFAGEWVSAVAGCQGPRILINRSGISARGMPVDGLSFTKATVSGATAHLVMELSPAARLAPSTMLSARGGAIRPEDLEVAATLIAQPRRVHPTNVIVRHKKSRQIQAADPAIMAIMTLVRCTEEGAMAAPAPQSRLSARHPGFR